MTTRLDARQSRQRALLDQLSNNTDVKLDTLLNLTNDELQMPLRLRQSAPTNLRLNIDAISVKTEDGAEGHGRSRTIQPIQGVLPSFTAGYIEFPSASAGSIVAVGLTLAASYTLTVSSGNWIKVGIALNSDGQVVLTFGTAGASESAATFPEFETGTLSIGYVSMQNSGGTIQNVTGARIYQFAGGGGGSGSGGSGTFKNYLESWFTGDRNVGTVSNSTVSASGNRTAPDASWASTNTSDMTISRTSSSPLRGKYSYLTTGTGSAANGSVFIESPVFTLDDADYNSTGGARALYVSGISVSGGSSQWDLALVRYSSSGVFQSIYPIVSTGSLSAATPPSIVLNNSGSGLRYSGVCGIGTGTAPDDKYALRIRNLSAPGGSRRFDDLYVGPNSDIGVYDQRFIGVKQFADEVELREGMNVPQTLDFTGTKTIPAAETTFAGKLDVASGTIIDLSASSSNLVVVGAITGSGSLTGSGTITSI